MAPKRVEKSNGDWVKSEKLIRTHQFNRDFEQWKSNANTTIKMASLTNELNNGWLNLSTNFNFKFLNTKAANGVVIYTDDYLTLQDLMFIADILKENTLKMGYVNYQSIHEEKLHQSNNSILQTHYLKVSLKGQNFNSFHQLYGNILLETQISEPSYLKILATYYQGRNYNNPLPFTEYLKHGLSLGR